MTDPIQPVFKLVQDFMPVLVTSKFDEDPIKNEQASLGTPFSHCKSIGNFSDAQGHQTLYGIVGSGRFPNVLKILCLSSLPASLIKIWSKTTEKRWRHCFPHYKSLEAFLLPWKPVFWSNLSRNLKQPSPHPYDAPTGLRDIQVSSEKLWQNDIIESGRTRQVQYSPHFSKQGYNKTDIMYTPENSCFTI